MTDHATTYPVEALGHDWTPGEHYHHRKHRKRFSGKAVIAGITVALAVQIVLGLFGVALGLGSVSTGNQIAAPSATTVTLGASMWAAVSIVSALFYGGFIAARLSKNSCHHMGILHGVVAWAGTVLVIAFLFSSALGGLFHGASQMLGGATAARPVHHRTAEADPISGTVSNQARDLINGGNTASTALTAEQAQADITAQLGILAAGGDDAPAAHKRAVADLQTQGVSATDAESRVSDWEAKSAQTKAQAKALADHVAHDAAKASVAAGVILLLALFTAGLGGSLGALHVKHHDHHHHHDAVQENPAPTTTV